ncbi:hypothetical protein ACFSC6_20625 [Rufibacter sediminis]|uniref:Outer membrane protein beta-barrel domain-containing protein n=1 Tax=Rufibacter sediminis TaxID=2762756 RepID=A0ABR6VPJ1_9BACT|nr:hypothetical protein [Rufibacter sediminis]MBC3539103.1 hypothetical protein [Rufibacter sediminis]
MAKGIVFLLCMLVAVLSANGQDLITRTDGVVLKATQLEITPNLVRFRLFESSDTLVYQISLTDVRSIQKEDGSVQTFAAIASPSMVLVGKASFNYETDLGQNIFFFHAFDLIYNNLTFAYERIFPAGKLGLKIPVTFGLSRNSDQYFGSFRENTVFGTGVELKVYPAGQGRFRYFLSPAVHLSTFRISYYANWGLAEESTASLYSAAVKAGGYYQFSKRFLFSADLGIGYRFFNHSGTTDEYYIYTNEVFVPANIHIGFRF